MDASNLLIVIPARGGSKGLPGKNAKSLGDHPLLKWTSDAILLSGLKNYQCVLSTDDSEIAEIGKSIGLNVPFIRPSELANDTATAVSVVKHALEWCKKIHDFQAEYLMLLQPTSPFRPPHIIHDAYKMLQESGTDAVIGVKPIYRNLSTIFSHDDQKNMRPLDEQAEKITRRQDVRTLYTPNGAMYAIKSNTLLTQNTLFPKNNKGLVMDKIQSHDIDDLTDWHIAESYVNSKIIWRTQQ